MKNLLRFLCVTCPSGKLHWRWERICNCGPEPFDLKAKRHYYRESEADHYRVIRQVLGGNRQALLKLPRRVRRRLPRELWPAFRVGR